MVFSSGIFLFLFLPTFLGLYYLVPDRFKNTLILIGSYCFYAWWRVDFLALFVTVTLWNWVFGQAIFNRMSKKESAKKLLIIAIAGNLGTLGYFKYANFGIDSLNSVLISMGYDPFELANIILPIGISFYIFQAISYVIDVYRKDVEPTKSFVDFAAFIALFPQLIAGPVLRYKDIAGQFESRTHTWAKFNEGCSLFMIGFCKKVLIADNVAPIADASFLLESPTFVESWLGILAYSSQLYFDFSGYSDMAIGLGLMMGFRFINNFNHPYISQSITEFWRRWHISLSSWLRDYLYISLGGNRQGSVKTYRNLFLTMLLGGLWHGANWTFVIWGAWHGTILAVEKYFGLGTSEKSNLKVARLVPTLILVMIGWVFFRSANIDGAFAYLSAMFVPEQVTGFSRPLLDIAMFSYAVLPLSWLIILYFGLKTRPTTPAESTSIPLWQQAAVSLSFVLAISKLLADSYSPFLYFQF